VHSLELRVGVVQLSSLTSNRSYNAPRAPSDLAKLPVICMCSLVMNTVVVVFSSVCDMLDLFNVQLVCLCYVSKSRFSRRRW
jgi:hypothetical protein